MNLKGIEYASWISNVTLNYLTFVIQFTYRKKGRNYEAND